MRITSKQFAQVLYEITDKKSKDDVQKSVAGFARYIYKERKLKLAEKIIGQFEKLYNQKKGIVEAEVVTAEKLDEALEKKIKSYIEKTGDAKKVVLKNTIDPKIKGGIILKAEDEVLDGSIAGKLGELKKILA